MSELPKSDEGLLALARVVMEQAEYTVATAQHDGVTILIAEDDNNAVVVAATVSAAEILEVEPVVGRVLTEQLIGAHLPQKKWDGYVVLLCAQAAGDDLSAALSELANNLRQLRRIIRVGVQPTVAGVARALRPLLPLPEPDLDTRLSDPLTRLEGLLLRDGVDTVAIQEVLEEFKLESEGISEGRPIDVDGLVELEDSADD